MQTQGGWTGRVTDFSFRRERDRRGWLMKAGATEDDCFGGGGGGY